MQITSDAMYALLEIHGELYYAYNLAANELGEDRDEIKTPPRLSEEEVGKILAKYGIDDEIDGFMAEVVEENIPDDLTLNNDVDGYFYS